MSTDTMKKHPAEPRTAQPAPAKATRVRMTMRYPLRDGVVLHMPIPPRPGDPYEVIVNHNLLFDCDTIDGFRTIAEQKYREICASFSDWLDPR